MSLYNAMRRPQEVLEQTTTPWTKKSEEDDDWLKDVIMDRKEIILEQEQKEQEEIDAIKQEIRDELVLKGTYSWKCYQMDKVSHKKVLLFLLNLDDNFVDITEAIPGERYQLFEIKLKIK